MSFSDHFKVSDIMPLENTSTERGKKIWLNLLPNVDLGHLLTMIGFTAALVVQWNSMDRRITIIEEQQKVLMAQYTESKSDQKATLNEVRGDVKAVKEALGDIKSVMALTQYRLEQSQTKGK
jgi:hypothetical protein